MSNDTVTPSPRELFHPVPVRIETGKRIVLNVGLFLLTALSTLFWGAYMMALFGVKVEPLGPVDFLTRVLHRPALLYNGISYSAAILLILLSHEMGHYLACCYYRIDATLPYFLPAPIVFTGTFGAFIRIRSPFPGRRSLFDVGLAGPLAGFVVAIPFLYYGLKWSIQVPISQITSNLGQFGEPLLFQIFSTFLFEKDMVLFLHPMGFAAWFACLATSINLLPIAQLDGGHVSYALFGRRAYQITWIFFAGVICLSLYGFTRSYAAGMQWLFYAILLLILKKIAGFRHPPTLNDFEPIGKTRIVLGVVALIVFILTFVPVTIIL